MSADFGAIETILSLFLAGLFGVTGYMLGYCIAWRGRPSMVLALVFASAAAWACVVFLGDYPHVLAASKAVLVANATLWPVSLGVVFGFLIHLNDPQKQQIEDQIG